MDEKEKALLVKLGECWNDYCALADRLTADDDDFYSSIHRLQRIIMARLARRSDPVFFKKG